MARKKRGKKKRDGKMKNRRGLSTIVVTLILVLIGLVAVALLWGPVSRLIKERTQITEIQNQFFSEQMNILSVYSNDPYVNITIRKPAGEIKSSSVNITGTAYQSGTEADIFSVVDLSGSMRECYGITSTQCGVLNGSWSNPTCTSLSVNAQTGCMSYGGVWNDKLTATQNANRDMITRLLGSGSSRIGLIAYRDAVVNSNSTDLTNDGVLLNKTLSSWQATSYTCICCGIRNATARLLQQSSTEKLKSIIVMSDGDANINCSGGGSNNAKNDSVKAACTANSTLNNLVIYSVGVQGADEATLTSIAKCGGGKYFSVANVSDLIGIYQAIAQQIEDRYSSLTAFSFLYITFFNGTDSAREKIFDIPEVLQTKTYNFNLEGKLSGKIIRIEIYPVIVINAKEEIIGPLLDSWEARYY